MTGFRYEKAENFDGVFNPSAGIVYKLSKKINLKGSYAHAFQIPGSYYRNNNYSSKPRIIPPFPPIQTPYNRTDMNLSPEKLRNIEFGANYSLSKNHKILVQYFRQEHSNSLNTETVTLYDSLARPPKNGYYVGYSNLNTSSILNCFQLSYFGEYKIFKYNIHGSYYVGNEEI